jgi:hypothetical protein
MNMVGLEAATEAQTGRPADAWIAAGLGMAIEADPGARWSVSCELRHRGGLTRLAFAGAGPVDRDLPGTAGDCRVTLIAGDGLTLVLTDARGNRSRTTVRGAGSVVRLRAG